MSHKVAGKKYFKLVEKKIRQLGYQFDHANACGGWIYTHATLPQVQVNTAMGEHAAVALGKKLDKQLGVVRESNKRNAAAIKSRRESDRRRAKAELDALNARRDRIVAEKLALPVGDISEVDREQRLELEREIESIERERMKWQRLMTELPSAVDNKARHRS